MTMYTNQSAEELEAMRCTSEGIFNAQNSVWMKINFGFTYLLILATFFLSAKAAMLLKSHNVYSNGTQLLLMFTLFNANLNQGILLEIRIRHLIHVLIHAKDPCQIEFHSPDCKYDQTIYAFTSILSTWLLCGLTFERFLALFGSSLYSKTSKSLAYFLIFLSVLLTMLVHFITYGGVSRAGYVPACHYPPQLALDTFQEVNNANFLFILFNCLLTVFILLTNLLQDRRIRKCTYDTKIRYASFENVLTTKAVCSITSTQFLFLSFSSAAVTTIRFFEAGMSEEVFHITAQYVAGSLYGNLSIPTLIYWKTNNCIKERKSAIGKMTNQSDHVDAHISSLRQMWEGGIKSQ